MWTAKCASKGEAPVIATEKERSPWSSGHFSDTEIWRDSLTERLQAFILPNMSDDYEFSNTVKLWLAKWTTKFCAVLFYNNESH